MAPTADCSNQSSSITTNNDEVRTNLTRVVQDTVVVSVGDNPNEVQQQQQEQPLKKGRSASTSSVDTARTSLTTECDEEEILLDPEDPPDDPQQQQSSSVMMGGDIVRKGTLDLVVESKSVQIQALPNTTIILNQASAAVVVGSTRSEDPHQPDRVVRFGHLSVHEFPCGLGDHPSVSSGPPIRLEYNGTHQEVETTVRTRSTATANPVYSYTIPVEDYEFSRPLRRTLPELLVPAATRRQWLLLVVTIFLVMSMQ